MRQSNKRPVTKMMRHTAFVAMYRILIKLRIIKLGPGFYLDPIPLDDYMIKFSLEDKYVE